MQMRFEFTICSWLLKHVSLRLQHASHTPSVSTWIYLYRTSDGKECLDAVVYGLTCRSVVCSRTVRGDKLIEDDPCTSCLTIFRRCCFLHVSVCDVHLKILNRCVLTQPRKKKKQEMHFCTLVHLFDLQLMPCYAADVFLEGNKWSESSVKFSSFSLGALALIPRLSRVVWAQQSQKLSALTFSNTIYLCHFACGVYLSL